MKAGGLVGRQSVDREAGHVLVLELFVAVTNPGAVNLKQNE